jgi:hypothetical protein
MKTLQLNYSFNKSTKQVTFTDINPIRLDSILLITDVTANVILYNFADPLKGGTVATNVLTLTYDTSALSNTDKLQIFYDDATATQNVTLPTAQVTTLTPPAAITGFATSAKQLADGHNVAVNNASGASAVNVQDGGNTLTVDGTVAVTNAGLTALNGAVNSSKVDVNIASGNPTTITATQSTASNLKVAATLDAETTKVIGVVRTSDGAGNLITSNSTTPTAHYAPDTNITSILGTAPSTVGQLDIIGTKTNNAVVPGTAKNLGVLPAVANASAPTWTETYDVKLSEDLSGNTRVTLGTLLAGENLTTNRLNVEPVYSYTGITAAAPTTTVVKNGAGTLHAIIINQAVATGVITVYDNNAGSGTKIATITQPAVVLSTSYVLLYDVSFATGCTIVTATAAQDITVCWR